MTEFKVGDEVILIDASNMGNCSLVEGRKYVISWYDPDARRPQVSVVGDGLATSGWNHTRFELATPRVDPLFEAIFMALEERGAADG